MSLFGQKEKEQIFQLQAMLAQEKQETERLRALLTPEHMKLFQIQEQIERSNEKIATQQKLLSDIDARIAAGKEVLKELEGQIVQTNEELLFQSLGLYAPQYEFASLDEYKEKLMQIRQEQKDLVKSDQAILGSQSWSVNGNAKQGEKMVSDTKKLLLRAFNSECDDIIERVKFSNIEASRKRIQKSYEAISKLGTMMQIRISERYYNLKLDEMDLAYEYQVKKQEDKEAQKEARARLREEAKLAKELEEARKGIEKEQKHYCNALKKLEAQLATASEEQRAYLDEKKNEIVQQLSEIEKSLQEVDYRQANQKAGYVYIISNIGAFGENVYKIGMTRRLEPMDRIDELGDASVPFNFDVHAMIFTEDAPKLEAALHQAFSDKKLNFINTRREFFKVSLDEIKAVVKQNFDKTVEFVDIAPAEQYRQSLLMREGSQ